MLYQTFSYFALQYIKILFFCDRQQIFCIACRHTLGAMPTIALHSVAERHRVQTHTECNANHSITLCG